MNSSSAEFVLRAKEACTDAERTFGHRPIQLLKSYNCTPCRTGSVSQLPQLLFCAP